MPRKPPDEKLAELEEKKAQIDALIHKHRARARVEERKRDTRRKIIAGALALEHAAVSSTFGEELRTLIAKHVTRPEDRKLFDLTPPQP